MSPAGTGGTPVAAMVCAGGTMLVRTCELLDEAPLVIDVEGVGRYTLMWTPTEEAAVTAEAQEVDGPCEADHPDGLAAGFTPIDGWLGEGAPSAALELAAGFVFSEGLFDRIDELVSLSRCPQAPDVVRVVLVEAARRRAHPALRTVNSGCGVCGADRLPEAGAAKERIGARTPMLSLPVLHGLTQAMQDRQHLWRRTGAAHAALLFDAQGEVLAFAEDLGRHNALDKAIGRCLLAGRPLAGGGVILSSRCSYEMLAKAARAGLDLVAAVSAPSALAVRMAHEHGITLCGFVRDARATIYTHPGRIGPGNPGAAQARSATRDARTSSGRAPLPA